MKLTVRTSSPLRPIAARARELSQACDELWIATAFVSEGAIEEVVLPAIERGAKVRFLTGTYGNTTRHRTFKRLAELAEDSALVPRVWQGNFHAKLYLWRRGGSAHVWVGSANLTDQGLQEPGELLAEISDRWTSSTIRSLRRGFEGEWRRATHLDATFLDTYQESSRTAFEAVLGHRSRKAAVRFPQATPGSDFANRGQHGRGMIALPITRHFAENSAIARRVEARLTGTAKQWYRSGSRTARTIRSGDLCLLVDVLDRTVGMVVATDAIRDGKATIVAYQSFTRLPDPKLTKTVRVRLVEQGLKQTKVSFRTQWLPNENALDVCEALYGRRIRLRLERTMRLRKVKPFPRSTRGRPE